MKKANRLLAFLMIMALMISLLAGCAGSATTQATTAGTTGATTGATTGGTTAATTAATTADIKPMTLTFATHLAATHPITKALYKFRDRVSELSGGKITVKTHISNELGDPTEVIDQIRIGVIDGGYFTTGHMAYYNKKLNATMWPYMFVSFDHAKNAYKGRVGEYMKEMAAEGGFLVLDWLYYGFRNLSSNRPVNTVADIKGLKIRVPSERVNQLTMAAFGGVIQTIAFNELYLALSQNVVDGQENPIATMDSAKVQEVNKNIAMIEYCFFTTGMVINPAKYKAWPANVQDIIKKASAEAAEYERQIFVDDENKLIEKFKTEYKVNFTYPDKKELQAAAKPAIDELKKDYDAAFVTEWLDLIEKSKVG